MIDDAEKKGLLKPGSVIIEPTSGKHRSRPGSSPPFANNRLILTMPDTMSVERRNLLKALGAEIVLTPGRGMKGAIAKAEALKAEHPGAIILQQFENPANPAVHVRHDRQEIWRDTDGKVDLFVPETRNGRTVSGCLGKR